MYDILKTVSKPNMSLLMILKLLGYYDKEISTEVEKNTFKINLNKKTKDNKEIFTEEEKKFIKEHGEVAFAQRFNKCPKCGEHMEHIGGCISCMSCSFTKCE